MHLLRDVWISLKIFVLPLNMNNAQNALEYWAFQWIFWYCLQQLSHIHWLKCVHFDMIDLKETKVPPWKFRRQVSHKYLLPYITLLPLPAWRIWALTCKQIIGCNCSNDYFYIVLITFDHFHIHTDFAIMYGSTECKQMQWNENLFCPGHCLRP